MDLRNIMVRMYKIASELTEINERAMVAAQMVNMQGFKRYHRCKSKEFQCSVLKIANAAADRHLTIYSNPPAALPPAPLPDNIRKHLEFVIEHLKPRLAELGQVNREFLEVVGVPLKCAVDMQDCVFHMLMKFERAYKRFSDTQWMLHDVYMYDKALHDKIKLDEGASVEY